MGLEATQYLDGGDNWDYISHGIPEEGRHMVSIFVLQVGCMILTPSPEAVCEDKRALCL